MYGLCLETPEKIIVVILTLQPNIYARFKLSKAILPSQLRMFNI